MATAFLYTYHDADTDGPVHRVFLSATGATIALDQDLHHYGHTPLREPEQLVEQLESDPSFKVDLLEGEDSSYIIIRLELEP